ncbi:N-acetyl-gamma-glutamyl-phosphate reductase [bacterium]|nr:N-acetyl-gamma-glutamyl-phosphate reductase [bacterium]
MNHNKKINVAVAGATGYTGCELIKLLARHNSVNLVALAHSRNTEDAPISKTFPELSGICDMMVGSIDAILNYDALEAVFLALPHRAAMAVAKPLLARGVKVIDLSADYRLRDVAVYEKWYEVEHKDTENLNDAVYGLCEHYREKIKSANLIANPGCYPTSVLLPLIPLLKAGLVKGENIIVDSKSGTTGAGRKTSAALQFCEVDGSFKAYGVFSHRHTPEIDQELSLAAGEKINVIFTPHLLPLQRGIQSTIYVDCKQQENPPTPFTKVEHPGFTSGVGEGDLAIKIANALKTAYKDDFFVRVKPEGTTVEIKNVANTNFCDISFFVSGNKLILTTVIDNLLKGASGQALQNFNIMYDFDETKGLI